MQSLGLVCGERWKYLSSYPRHSSHLVGPLREISFSLLQDLSLALFSNIYTVEESDESLVKTCIGLRRAGFVFAFDNHLRVYVRLDVEKTLHLAEIWGCDENAFRSVGPIQSYLCVCVCVCVCVSS